MTRVLPALLLACLALLAALAGCSDDDDAPTTGTEPATGSLATTSPPTTITVTVPAQTTTQPQGRDSVLVYLVRGEAVGVARRRVMPTTGVAQAAMQELLAGPSADEAAIDLGSEIPPGTRLNGVRVAGGTATVDLSRDFEAGGGSLSIRLRVAQVVHTLTQFATVRRVAFAIDGEPVEAIGGEGLIVDPPLGRADVEDLAPPILLEQPAPGDVVTSPIRLRGTGNTFEAAFVVRLLDEDGRVLAEEPERATSGTGTRGTFDLMLPYEIDRPGRGTLRVFEESARDGSEVNVVEIPLRLE